MKTKLFICLALATLMLNSCESEKFEETISQSSAQDKPIHVCIDKTPHTTLSNRGSVLNSNKWTNGQTVRVKFLNGTAFLQNKVQQYAMQWKDYANINLVFVVSGDAEIKINFDSSGQSWSYYGSYSANIPQNEASMNFGWFYPNTAEAEFSRTVLHEFGHALGLVHEQSSPNQNIQWNKPLVYAYYANSSNGGWTAQQVDSWVFARFDETQTNSSAYDPLSIMHYYLPAEFTLNGFSVGWNNYLSNTDKAHIANVYPYPAGVQNVVTFYKHHDYNPSGYAIGLPVGDYTLSQLEARGILNDDISSLKVVSGYRVTIYRDDYFSNSALSFFGDQPNFFNINGWNFNDLTSSVKIVRL